MYKNLQSLSIQKHLITSFLQSVQKNFLGLWQNLITPSVLLFHTFLMIIKPTGSFIISTWFCQTYSFQPCNYLCVFRGVTVFNPLLREQHWLWEHFLVTLVLCFPVRDAPVKGELLFTVLYDYQQHRVIMVKQWIHINRLFHARPSMCSLYVLN